MGEPGRSGDPQAQLHPSTAWTCSSARIRSWT